MKGVITAPANIIKGAFTILFSFPSNIILTQADIIIETLEGDALGHAKDSFGGGGNHYHLLCYLPDEKLGKSRIHLNKNGVTVQPVDIAYDSVRTVIATYGVPIRRNRKIEIPITLDAPIKQLRKQHVLLSEPVPFRLYGNEATYQIVVSPPPGLTQFKITISGTVEKTNEVQAVISEATLEIIP
ncbi:hypothetical protein F4054_23795 [Candidatus Poribacteria bacterium]|nr:hypothetical protein [Candidatus Poribacteria bacterium]MYG06767.1 hypothetical protein [Candidatus Poribacteria bacterium]MYK25277.1 hypothetical protein [Candidatus Poribacteria bacterium]